MRPAGPPVRRSAGRLAPSLLVALLLSAAACSRPERPCVLLVSIDTLRADRLGHAGWPEARTPNLDALAAEGVRFRRAYTVTPLTLPAHASLLTGTDPAHHGVRDNGSLRLGDSHETLATRLAEEGWDTAAFVGAWVLHASFGLERGFSVYDDVESGRDRLTTHFAERDAAEVVDAAAAWLARGRDAPWFAWVHVFDPHAPYLRHEGLGLPPSASAYDHEIAFVDRELGRLLEAAREAAGERGLVVAVTSDHGEGLGDHGEATHGLFLYESTLRVPLILWRDRGLAPAERDEPVSLVDLAPTLLAQAGASPLPRAQGRDLFGDEPAAGLHAETFYPYLAFGWSPLHAWIVGDEKLIEAPRPELYDVAEDPAEARDLAGERPERLTALRRELVEAIDRLSASAAGAERRELSAAELEALQALGYVASRGTSLVAARTLAPEPGLADPKDLAPLHEAFQREVARLEAARSADDGAAVAAALESLEAAWADGLRSPKLCSILVTEWARSGRDGEALPLAQECVRSFPDEPLLRRNLGRLHVDAGRWAEALEQYRRALEAQPGDLGLARDCARLHEELGEVDEALALYRRVLAEPEHDRFPASTHARVGSLLLAQGRSGEALEHLREARELAGEEELRRALDETIAQLEAAGRRAP